MTGYVATLINDPAERERRRRDKRDQVLRWLRLNTWSTSEVLRKVVGFNSRQAIAKLLQGLCREELIRSATISGEFGRPVIIWGITTHGAALAALEGEPVSIRTFEPSKVNPLTMQHALDIQVLQLRAQNGGWRWQAIDGELSRSEAKYADAVALRPDGGRVALEVERTVKTAKRYAEILIAHLEARKQGKWDWVYYLSPNAVISNRVRRSYEEIRVALWRGKRIKVTKAHLAPFKFYAYDDNWI